MKEQTDTSFGAYLEWIWSKIVGAFNAVIDWIGPLDFGTVLLIIFILILGGTLYLTFRMVRLQTAMAGKDKKKDDVVVPDVSWNDIAGCEEAIESLQEVVGFLNEPKRFANLGARVPKGVLLHGPPGTGKTLLAKAVAANAGAKFFAENGAGFVQVYVGTGAARVREIFKQARECGGPAVVFIDEIDAIGGKRTSSDHGGNSEYERTLNQILSELDGFHGSKHPIIMIAATNRVENLDAALTRPGRIDRKIHVPPPDLRGREKILRIHTRGMPLGPEVDLNSVARRTTGMSGADLANIANEAAIIAGRRKSEVLEQNDFLSAARHEVVGQATKRPLTERERKIVAYHEAGHTVLAVVQDELKDPVESVTIVPHSSGSLGHTLTGAGEDRHLSHRQEIEAELRMLMGGRAGELTIEEESNGASGDMQRAHQLARAYVGAWGWGESKLFWPTNTADISDLTRRELDEAAAELASRCLFEAQEILYEYQPLLKDLAKALLDQETLEREEIEEICQLHGIAAKEGSLFSDQRLAFQA